MESQRSTARILASLNIFRLSFRNCINCLFICVDLRYIIFFIPRFKYTKFINSSFFFFLTQLLIVHSLFQMKENSHEIKFQRVISRKRSRKGKWSSFVNLFYEHWIVHSHQFFRKSGRNQALTVTGGHPPSPNSIKPRPLTLSARSRRSYGKIGVCEQPNKTQKLGNLKSQSCSE